MKIAKITLIESDASLPRRSAPRIMWPGEKWLIHAWSAADFQVSIAAQPAAMIR